MPMDWDNRDPAEEEGYLQAEWSDLEEDKEDDIMLSEQNVALLTSSFSGTLTNSERRKVRSSFPAPDVSQTQDLRQTGCKER